MALLESIKNEASGVSVKFAPDPGTLMLTESRLGGEYEWRVRRVRQPTGPSTLTPKYFPVGPVNQKLTAEGVLLGTNPEGRLGLGIIPPSTLDFLNLRLWRDTGAELTVEYADGTPSGTYIINSFEYEPTVWVYKKVMKYEWSLELTEINYQTPAPSTDPIGPGGPA